MTRPNASARAARAAFVLAALLFAASGPEAPLDPIVCLHPLELRARADHSVAVACGAGEAPGRVPRGPARRLFGLAIDPNSADAATLMTLPGIGAVRAAAIVEERHRGRFHSVEDLLQVRGIGPTTLAGLAGIVAVAPPPAEPVRCRWRKCRTPPASGEEVHESDR